MPPSREGPLSSPVERERTLILQFIDQLNQASTPQEACAQAVLFLQRGTPFCNPDAFLVDPKDPNRVVRVANQGTYRPGGLTLARGQGVVGRAFETRATQVVDDVRLDPDYVESCKEARSEIAVPLLWRQEIFGVLDAESPRLHAYRPKDVRLMELLASLLAHCLSHFSVRERLGRALGAAQLREAALQKLSRQQRGLVDLLVKMGGHVSLDALFRDVVEDLHGVLGYEHVYLACRSRRDEPVRLQCFQGFAPPEEQVTALLESRGGLVGRILETGKPYLCPDTRKDPLVVAVNPEARCELGVPLLGSDGHTWGFLLLNQGGPGSLTPQDGEILTALAASLVLRLERREAFDSLQRELDRMRLIHGLVQDLGQTRELPDLAQRVVDLVAQRMGCHLVSFYEVREEGTVLSLRFLASSIIPREDLERRSQELTARGGGLVCRCARLGRLMNHRDIGPEAGFVSLVASGTRHQLDVPISFSGRIRGVLSLESLERPFDGEDEAAFQILAGHLGALWAVRDLIGDMRLQTMKDPLTGLWNRRYLEARMQEEQGRLGRDEEPLSLALVDLTDFKETNDRYGHFVGDLVLQETARCLKDSVRASDVAARYGGDEFVVLFPRTSPEGAREVMRRFEARLARLAVPGGPEGVPCDHGVAGFPEDGRDLTDLLKLADERMYRHKGERKHRFPLSLLQGKAESS